MQTTHIESSSLVWRTKFILKHVVTRSVAAAMHYTPTRFREEMAYSASQPVPKLRELYSLSWLMALIWLWTKLPVNYDAFAINWIHSSEGK